MVSHVQGQGHAATVGQPRSRTELSKERQIHERVREAARTTIAAAAPSASWGDLPGLRVSGVVDPRDQDTHVPAAAVERIADHAAVRRMRFHGAALAIRDDDVADDLAASGTRRTAAPGVRAAPATVMRRPSSL